MFPTRIEPRLAAGQRKRIEGKVPASLLQRLVEAVPALGEVTVDLGFFRDDQGRCCVEGQLAVDLELQCQRCLQDFATHIEADVKAAVVWSDEQARNLPAELDPWLVEGEVLDLGSALEDELLLSLPTMPLHPREDCTGATGYRTDRVVEINKPFAGLHVLKGHPENEN